MPNFTTWCMASRAETGRKPRPLTVAGWALKRQAGEKEVCDEREMGQGYEVVGLRLW